VVLPLAPEMIRNEGEPGDDRENRVSPEEQRQDCERKAAQRLLEKHGDYYQSLKAALLGMIYMPITRPARPLRTMV
jgi:hypothetical protein